MPALDNRPSHIVGISMASSLWKFREDRIRLLTLIGAILLCFVVQAQAAIVPAAADSCPFKNSGAAKIPNGCCGGKSKCCCDMQQDSSSGNSPDHSALVSSPTVTKDEPFLSATTCASADPGKKDYPHPGTRVRIHDSAIHLFPLNLRC